jgi:hypothetical protein
MAWSSGSRFRRCSLAYSLYSRPRSHKPATERARQARFSGSRSRTCAATVPDQKALFGESFWQLTDDDIYMDSFRENHCTSCELGAPLPLYLLSLYSLLLFSGSLLHGNTFIKVCISFFVGRSVVVHAPTQDEGCAPSLQVSATQICRSCAPAKMLLWCVHGQARRSNSHLNQLDIFVSC